MLLYNVTWQFPEIEGQKAAYASYLSTWPVEQKRIASTASS